MRKTSRKSICRPVREETTRIRADYYETCVTPQTRPNMLYFLVSMTKISNWTGFLCFVYINIDNIVIYYTRTYTYYTF